MGRNSFMSSKFVVLLALLVLFLFSVVYSQNHAIKYPSFSSTVKHYEDGTVKSVYRPFEPLELEITANFQVPSNWDSQKSGSLFQFILPFTLSTPETNSSGGFSTASDFTDEVQESPIEPQFMTQDDTDNLDLVCEFTDYNARCNAVQVINKPGWCVYSTFLSVVSGRSIVFQPDSEWMPEAFVSDHYVTLVCRMLVTPTAAILRDVTIPSGVIALQQILPIVPLENPPSDYYASATSPPVSIFPPVFIMRRPYDSTKSSHYPYVESLFLNKEYTLEVSSSFGSGTVLIHWYTFTSQFASIAVPSPYTENMFPFTIKDGDCGDVLTMEFLPPEQWPSSVECLETTVAPCPDLKMPVLVITSTQDDPITCSIVITPLYTLESVQPQKEDETEENGGSETKKTYPIDIGSTFAGVISDKTLREINDLRAGMNLSPYTMVSALPSSLATPAFHKDLFPYEGTYDPDYNPNNDPEPSDFKHHSAEVKFVIDGQSLVANVEFMMMGMDSAQTAVGPVVPIVSDEFRELLFPGFSLAYDTTTTSTFYHARTCFTPSDKEAKSGSTDDENASIICTLIPTAIATDTQSLSSRIMPTFGTLFEIRNSDSTNVNVATFSIPLRPTAANTSTKLHWTALVIDDFDVIPNNDNYNIVTIKSDLYVNTRLVKTTFSTDPISTTIPFPSGVTLGDNQIFLTKDVPLVVFEIVELSKDDSNNNIYTKPDLIHTEVGRYFIHLKSTDANFLFGPDVDPTDPDFDPSHYSPRQLSFVVQTQALYPSPIGFSAVSEVGVNIECMVDGVAMPNFTVNVAPASPEGSRPLEFSYPEDQPLPFDKFTPSLIECYIPFSFDEGYDQPSTLVVGVDNIPLFSANVPPVQLSQVRVGLLPTRPFFLNQINFGTIQISGALSTFTTVMYTYPFLTLYSSSDDVTCFNNGAPQVHYQGQFNVFGNSTTIIQLSFEPDVIKKIQEDSDTAGNTLSCTNLPLRVQAFESDTGSQTIQVIDSSGSANFSTSAAKFPSVYVFTLRTALTQGKTSKITFTLINSIDGPSVIHAPYSLEGIDDSCYTTNREILSTVAMKIATTKNPYYLCYSTPSGPEDTDPECKRYDSGTFITITPTERQVDPANTSLPQCTFTGTLTYSRPSQSLLAPIYFTHRTKPDGEQDLTDPALDVDRLYKYTIASLFPSISYLPAVLDFSFKSATDDTAPDYITLDMYNSQIDPKTAKFELVHFLPFDDKTEDEIAQGYTINAKCTTFDTGLEVPNLLTINVFSRQSAKQDDTLEYVLSFQFNGVIASASRHECDIPIKYTNGTLKPPMTVLGTGTFGRGDIVSYLNLPAVTSQYDFIWSTPFNISNGSTGQGTFSLQLTNNGEQQTTNSIFINFATLGLAASTSFTCNTNTSVNLSTSYSELTLYTLSIQNIPVLQTKQSIIISCTFTVTTPIPTPTSTYITATLYENESGVYGVQNAVSNKPYEVTVASIAFTRLAIVDFLVHDKIHLSTLHTTLTKALEDARDAYEAIISGEEDPKVVSAAQQKFDLVKNLGVLTDDLLSSNILRRQAYLPLPQSIDDFGVYGIGFDEPTQTLLDSVQGIVTIAFEVGLPSDTNDHYIDELFLQILNEIHVDYIDIFSIYRSFYLPTKLYPSSCLSGGRCGTACPLQCYLNDSCNNNFECESLSCSRDRCVVLDKSTYPSDYFSNY